MQKQVYICDLCKREVDKSRLFIFDKSVKCVSSNTGMASYKTEICIKCIKSNNSEFIKIFNLDLAHEISRFYPDILTEIELKKANMCDECEYEIPECKARKVEFGIGKGFDNVVKCDCYKKNNNLV